MNFRLGFTFEIEADTLDAAVEIAHKRITGHGEGMFGLTAVQQCECGDYHVSEAESFTCFVSDEGDGCACLNVLDSVPHTESVSAH